jgi:hypothetical protein
MTNSARNEHRIEQVSIDDIKVSDRLRAINPTEVQHIAESITQIGLQTPIMIRETKDGDKILVCGMHRLEAAKSIGLSTIPCQVVRIDDRTARLREISENMHRAELTQLERDENIAEWVRLISERETLHGSEKSAEAAEFQSAQIGPIESKRKDGRGHRKESGTNGAARALGIDRHEAQRAIKRTESIPLEIRDEIRSTPSIADKGVELDALANASPEDQKAAVAAVKTGAAKNLREILAKSKHDQPSPVPEKAASSLSDTALSPLGEPLGQNPDGAISSEKDEEYEDRGHDYCIRLTPFCDKWDNKKLAETIDDLLDIAMRAPDAPSAENIDPAVTTGFTRAVLEVWLKKLSGKD